MPLETPPERQTPTTPERAPRLETRDEAETLRVRARLLTLHRGVLVLPGKERDDIRTAFDGLKAEREAVLDAIDAAAANPALLRTAIVALATYEEHHLAFSMRRDQLIHGTAVRIANALSLPAEDLVPLKQLLEYGVTAPKKDASDAVKERFAAVSSRRMDALRALTEVVKTGGEVLPADSAKPIRAAWNAYRDAKAEYDDAADAEGAAALAGLIGINGDPAYVRRFIDEITAPLPPLEGAAPSIRSDRNMRALYERLEAQRVMLRPLLVSIVRNGFNPEDEERWSWTVTEYLLARGAYQSEALAKKDENDEWLMYGTVVAQELLEEGVEMIPGLEMQRMEFLRGLTGPVRLKVLRGLRELRTQGIPARMLGKTIEAFGRSPLGPKFWNELFKVESAATILLWGLYLHNSPNKFQASIQFGSFIALSNAVNRLSAPVLEALGAMKVASRFRVPGVNFILQFAIAMGAAYVAADKIVEFSEWVDKTIPDSALKHKGTTVLSIVSGEPIFSGIEDISELTGATGLLDKAGLTGFDPDRDLMAYLGTEAIRGGEFGTSSYLELDYRYTRGLDDWNNRLEQAISAQDNVVQKKLWDTLHVDAGEWASRQALQLYSTVSGARSDERSLEADLRAAGVLGVNERLPGLEIATMDTDGEKRAAGYLETFRVRVGDDLTNRNDRIVARAFDWDATLAKCAKHCAALPAKDPKRVAWERYERACKDIAKNVSIYRHTKVYSRRAWLGDVAALGEGTGLGTLPPSVRNGLLAEVRHQMARRDVLTPEAFPELTRSEFREKLVGTVKFQDKLSFLETGYMLFARNAEYQGTQRAARDAYSSLMLTVQDAQKTLPDDVMERVLQPIRELALAGRVASYEEIRAARAALNAAVIEHDTKGMKVQSAPADIRGDLGLSDKAVVLLQGPADAAVYNYTRKVVDPKLFINATEKEVPGQFRPFQSLKSDPGFDDLHIARTRDDGAFFRTYQHVAFDCSSSDRGKWRVQVTQGNLTTTHFKKEDGTRFRVDFSWRRDPTPTTISFADWQKTNMELAYQIEPQLDRVQREQLVVEKRRAAEQELRALQERVQRSELEVYMITMNGGMLPPDQLPTVPARLARDPVFAPAYERQARITAEWKALEDGGLQKIFALWSQAAMKLDVNLIGRFDRYDTKPRGPSTADIVNAYRIVRKDSTWIQHQAFLDRAVAYARLCAEQKEFLRKTPIPKPSGPEKR